MRGCAPSLLIQYTQIHTHARQQLVWLVSPSVQDLHESPGGTRAAEPLEVEVLKNIIKCGRADMTAGPLRALTVVRKGLASLC